MHLVDLSPLFTREVTFLTSCLLFCTSNLFVKGISLTVKHLLPSFHFREAPFSEGNKNNIDRVTFLESVSFLLMGATLSIKELSSDGVGCLKSTGF